MVLQWQSSGRDRWDSLDVQGEETGSSNALGLNMEMKKVVRGGVQTDVQCA